MSLGGKRVLVTRPEGQSEGFMRSLQRMGAETILMPGMKILPLEDTSVLDRALSNLSNYDWLILTSVNGVDAVSRRLAHLGIKDIGGPKIAVIGPKTAAACKADLRAPDLVPEQFVSESLAESFGEVRGLRFLLLRADNARANLRLTLKERGASVDEISVYRAVPSEIEIDPTTAAPDYITFTSAASARAVIEKLREAGLSDWLSKAKITCIGPITASAVADLGIAVAATADPYTEEGLLQALVNLSEKQEKTHV